MKIYVLDFFAYMPRFSIWNFSNFYFESMNHFPSFEWVTILQFTKYIASYENQDD